MPPTEQTFTSTIAELAVELSLGADLILVKDAIELKTTPDRAPAGAKGKTVFAVTPEDDPFLRGIFINAGWQHRGTGAGDVFWRAFP